MIGITIGRADNECPVCGALVDWKNPHYHIKCTPDFKGWLAGAKNTEQADQPDKE